jgi:PAS domain S-box-containing protein
VQLRTRSVRDVPHGRHHFEAFVQDITRRKRAEDELKASQDRFAKAFRASPAAMAISRRRDGVLLDVNDSWVEMFGLARAEAIGRSAVRLGLIDAGTREAAIQRLERDGRLRNEELRVRTRTGQRDVLYCGELLDLGGEPCVITLALDVSERERVKRALHESEERLQLVGRATMKDVMWDWDIVADTQWWGEAVQAVFGYRPGEMGGNYGGWRGRIHPDDVEHLEATIAAARKGKDEWWSGEYRFRRKDGTYAPVLDRCYIKRDAAGKPVRFVGSMMDLTETRRAEAELRALAARLQSIREEERKRLSRELHDELSQVLTALKIDLSQLQRTVGQQSAAHERIDRMKELLDRATSETHRIAMELRPTILDDLGLVSAVRWLVEDFTRRTGIPCELVTQQLQEPLSEDVATTVFRIVQETLTNIARHAAASRVDLVLAQDDARITVRVSDNGRGIPRDSTSREQHLGLLGLRERAAQLGGELSVRSRRDRGTSVVVRVPLKAT